MRSVLVFADRTDSSTDTRLEAALSLARAGKGHVSVLVDTPVARYMSMDGLGGSYFAADAIRDALEGDDAYAARLEERLRNEDVPFDIQRGEEEPVDALVEVGRLADVIVVSRGCLFTGQLAMTARTPILVVPKEGAVNIPFERACIAWDGGEESASALRAAVPLLEGCGEVHVLSVREKSGGFPSVEAMRYLSRHGISAELLELSRTGSVEETLAAQARRLRADLLVMGAYGHSRLREFLLGGVTRYFLDNAQAPVLLLAH